MRLGRARFGDGTIVLHGTFVGSRLDRTFRLLFDDGSVLGTVSLPCTTSGNEIDFLCTGRLTGGTGPTEG